MALVQSHRGRKLRIHRHIVLAVVGVAFVVCLAKLWQPMRVARQQSQVLVHLRREKAALAEDHAQLQEYKDKLASDEGVEAAARRNGYLKAGDRRIVFVEGKDKGKAKKPAPAPKKEK
jgi:hypothetical protein